MSTATTRVESLALLRESVAVVRPRDVPALPFGLDEMDKRLGDGGIDGGALHDVAPAAPSLSDDAAAALCVAGVAARFARIGEGRVLWAVSRFDLYAPGLKQAGLPPGRVIFAEGREDKDVLALPMGTRHRVAGLLLEAQRGLILEIDGGGVYALDADFVARRHLGSRVTVEGVRSGFDRLDVDWIGPVP